MLSFLSTVSLFFRLFAPLSNVKPLLMRRVLMGFVAAVRVNETDTFADDEGQNDEYFDFEDISGKWLLDLRCEFATVFLWCFQLCCVLQTFEHWEPAGFVNRSFLHADLCLGSRPLPAAE